MHSLLVLFDAASPCGTIFTPGQIVASRKHLESTEVAKIWASVNGRPEGVVVINEGAKYLQRHVEDDVGDSRLDDGTRFLRDARLPTIQWAQKDRAIISNAKNILSTEMVDVMGEPIEFVMETTHLMSKVRLEESGSKLHTWADAMEESFTMVDLGWSLHAAGCVHAVAKVEEEDLSLRAEDHTTEASLSKSLSAFRHAYENLRGPVLGESRLVQLPSLVLDVVKMVTVPSWTVPLWVFMLN